MDTKDIKVVILAGGLGTRIAEETSVRPKPMIEVGGKPIIWHIMKIYSSFGFQKFVICLGYKGYVIKEFFSNYFLHTADVTINMSSNTTEVHERFSEPWEVTLVDTGDSSMTGGRLKRVLRYVKDDPVFALTYGDGVSDLPLDQVLKFHLEQAALATVTAVRPSKRFGALSIEGTRVTRFEEKPEGEGGWINGGFFFLSPKVGDLIDGDATIWEKEPLERLASAGQLRAYQHHGFWQAMDTLRDKQFLEEEWSKQRAKWKRW